MKKLYAALAWYGVIVILAGYFLTVFGYLDVNSPIYLFLNLSGSFGIAVDSLNDKDYQPAVLNIVWFLIAMIGIINYYL